MAKYIGLLTSDARGKLGGLVLSRARGSTTLKSNVLPPRSRSVAQNSRSYPFATALLAWRALTQTQQLSWSVVAATVTLTNSLGTTYAPTGLQLWTQCYVASSFFGYTPPSTAPSSIVAPPPILGITAAVLGTDCRVTVSVGSGLSVPPFYLSASAPLRAGVTYTKTLSKFICESAYGVDFVNIFPPYQGHYGVTITAGMTLALRATPCYPGVWNTGTFLDIPVVVSIL